MVDGCLEFFDIVIIGRCAWVNFSMRTLHYAIRALRELVLQSCKAPRAVAYAASCGFGDCKSLRVDTLKLPPSGFADFPIGRMGLGDNHFSKVDILQIPSRRE